MVRDIRQSGTLAFVACWTAEGASKMLEGGIRKLGKAGIHVATVSRARFREDLHNHEINPRAPTRITTHSKQEKKRAPELEDRGM